MLVIPGQPGRDTCDGITRRDLLRVGGSALLGISLANLFQLQEASAKSSEGSAYGGPGFGKAKSVILVYLQGGPSHLDLWDPKDNVPSNVKSVFKAIDTKLPGIKFTEVLPKLAQGMPAGDKATAKYDRDKYYGKALGLVVSGRARNAFDLGKEKPATRERYGNN